MAATIRLFTQTALFVFPISCEVTRWLLDDDRWLFAKRLLMITRKIVISDPIHMPEVYSSTPGGTLYSTTPGGTKLIYERAFMKNLRGSPLSQTPPSNVPSCLLRGTPRTPFRKCVPVPTELVKSTKSLKIEDQEQFQLDL